MLAGYTYGRNRIEDLSIDFSPNFLITASGYISPDVTVTGATRCQGCGASNADRPNQFKLTGMYILPWQDVIVSANYLGLSGPPITRQISRALAIGGAQTINVEPLGSLRLDFQNKIDLRLGKMIRIAQGQTLEASLDFDNVMNDSWVRQARSMTKAKSFTD